MEMHYSERKSYECDFLQRPHLSFQRHSFGSRNSARSNSFLITNKATTEFMSGNRCSVCQKSFSTPGSLKRHMELHIFQRKNFHCHMCGKRFSWKTDWRNHMKLKHNVA